MYGEGIIKGMAQTAKNFFESYTSDERLTTVEYPEERLPMTPATRNFPFLVFDADPEKGLRCVACKICEKECPPQCIYIVLERDEKGKPKKAPRIFDIDISVCMSCQICAEVCPFDAIKMDQVYELSRTDRFGGLLLHKEDLRKSNEYYREIHPDEAAEVDARLEAEKAKAAAAAAAKAAAAAAPKPAAAAAAAGAVGTSSSITRATVAAKPAAAAAPPGAAPAAKPPAGGAVSPATTQPPPAKPVEVAKPIATTAGEAARV